MVAPYWGFLVFHSRLTVASMIAHSCLQWSHLASLFKEAPPCVCCWSVFFLVMIKNPWTQAVWWSLPAAGWTETSDSCLNIYLSTITVQVGSWKRFWTGCRNPDGTCVQKRMSLLTQQPVQLMEGTRKAAQEGAKQCQDQTWMGFVGWCFQATEKQHDSWTEAPLWKDLGQLFAACRLLSHNAIVLFWWAWYLMSHHLHYGHIQKPGMIRS